MPSAPPASDGMQAALAFLGVGPMHAYNSQADTLEGELDDYLAAPLKYCIIVEFWQVCNKPFTVEQC